MVMKIQEGVLCLTHLEKLFDQRHRVDQGKYVWSEQILEKNRLFKEVISLNGFQDGSGITMMRHYM